MTSLPKPWSPGDLARFVAAFATTLVVAALFIVVVVPALGSRTGTTASPAATEGTGSPTSAAGGGSPGSTAATPLPSAGTSATPSGSILAHDTVAVTVSDRLRVRSRPEVSDASLKYDPVLPIGTELFVLDGPVNASGYDWYEIAPLTPREFTLAGQPVSTPSGGLTGWVAAAARDGTAWIGPGQPTCPAPPTGFAALDALTLGQRLACFDDVPLTLRARLVPCSGIDGAPAAPVTWTCDESPGAYDPAWFGGGDPAVLLADPKARGTIAEWGEWQVLHLVPGASAPSTLPLGQVVTVTGVFDHPAASGCRVSVGGAAFEATRSCRFLFAVTGIR